MITETYFREQPNVRVRENISRQHGIYLRESSVAIFSNIFNQQKKVMLFCILALLSGCVLQKNRSF